MNFSAIKIEFNFSENESFNLVRKNVRQYLESWTEANRSGEPKMCISIPTFRKKNLYVKTKDDRREWPKSLTKLQLQLYIDSIQACYLSNISQKF